MESEKVELVMGFLLMYLKLFEVILWNVYWVGKFIVVWMWIMFVCYFLLLSMDGVVERGCLLRICVVCYNFYICLVVFSGVS